MTTLLSRLGACVLLSLVVMAGDAAAQSVPLETETQRFRVLSAAQKNERLAELAATSAEEDSTLVAVIYAAFDDRDPSVRATALGAMFVVASRFQGDSDPKTVQRQRTLIQALRPVALKAMTEPNAIVRRQGLYALWTMDNQTGVPVEVRRQTLLQARKSFEQDPEPEVRATALRILLSDAGTRSDGWRLLEQGFRDKSPQVRNQAYQGAVLVESTDAIPYLLAALNEEEDAWGRLSAASALRAFVPGNPQLAEGVEQRAREETNLYIREQMAKIAATLRASLKPRQ